MCDLDGAKKSLESLLDEVRELKAERASVNELSLHCQELEARLNRIFNLGHNDDCMFCGFKDKEALKGLGKEVKP